MPHFHTNSFFADPNSDNLPKEGEESELEDIKRNQEGETQAKHKHNYSQEISLIITFCIVLVAGILNMVELRYFYKSKSPTSFPSLEDISDEEDLESKHSPPQNLSTPIEDKEALEEIKRSTSLTNLETVSDEEEVKDFFFCMNFLACNKYHRRLSASSLIIRCSIISRAGFTPGSSDFSRID